MPERDDTFCRRIGQLRDLLATRDLDGLLVLCRENQEYLTGFVSFRDSSRHVNCIGEVLVTPHRATIFPNHCDVRLLREEASACFEIVEPGKGGLGGVLREESIARLGFEADTVSHGQFGGYQEALHFLELVPVSGLVEQMRAVKDEGELAVIRRAVEIADQALADALSLVKPGVTELEIAIQIECSMRRQRAMKSSFDPIITSGPRTAFVHAAASDRAVQAGELLLIDFGAGYQDYFSDVTRTVVVGKPSREQEDRYQVILEAQRQATEAARPGARCGEVDAIARQVITDGGCGEYLLHSVGHGVGRSVHEPPWLGAGQETLLQENMVITIEPGLYVPGWGGMRVEDMILVTAHGPEILTTAPKGLALDG